MEETGRSLQSLADGQSGVVERIALTGDVFVNLKGFTSEQAAFNRLAPYLMTSVDTDPQKAAAERQALKSVLGGGVDCGRRARHAGCVAAVAPPGNIKTG